MQAFYDAKPSIFEPVGNGSYLYHYNIKEVTTTSEDDETRTQWQCDEVVVWMPINANRVTQAAIADRWDSDYEQKLINEYNGAQMGLYGGSAKSEEAKAIIAKYTEFLTARTALKAQIDADCDAMQQQMEVPEEGEK